MLKKIFIFLILFNFSFITFAQDNIIQMKPVINLKIAKIMGAKDITDLKNLIEKQISSQYSQALNSITKKEILELGFPQQFPKN